MFKKYLNNKLNKESILIQIVDTLFLLNRPTINSTYKLHEFVKFHSYFILNSERKILSLKKF